ATRPPATTARWPGPPACPTAAPTSTPPPGRPGPRGSATCRTAASTSARPTPSGSTASPSGATSSPSSTRTPSRSSTTRAWPTGTSPGISGRRATPPAERPARRRPASGRQAAGQQGDDPVLDLLGQRPAEPAVDDEGEAPGRLRGDPPHHGRRAVDPAGLGRQADFSRRPGEAPGQRAGAAGDGQPRVQHAERAEAGEVEGAEQRPARRPVPDVEARPVGQVDAVDGYAEAPVLLDHPGGPADRQAGPAVLVVELLDQHLGPA